MLRNQRRADRGSSVLAICGCGMIFNTTPRCYFMTTHILPEVPLDPALRRTNVRTENDLRRRANRSGPRAVYSPRVLDWRRSQGGSVRQLGLPRLAIRGNATCRTIDRRRFEKPSSPTAPTPRPSCFGNSIPWPRRGVATKLSTSATWPPATETSTRNRRSGCAMWSSTIPKTCSCTASTWALEFGW